MKIDLFDREVNVPPAPWEAIHVKIKFIDPVLGTCSGDSEIHRKFIASKSPDATTIEEELAALGVDEVADQKSTFFPRWNNKPFIYDYHVRGYFKDTCKALRTSKGTKSSKCTAYKTLIDGNVFVADRMNFLSVPYEMEMCERPLRAQTAQGERIALASSEQFPEGTSFECVILMMDNAKADMDTVREWLDYGCMKGMMQWRNSGKGRFEWEELGYASGVGGRVC